MKHAVYIQTNHKQLAGALVAKHAIHRYSQNNDKFDIHIINKNEYPYFDARECQLYSRDGIKRRWLNNDLQSFTLTRFMPPQLMNYQGRALVIDPDVFATSDVWDLLSKDMKNKAILCRPRSGSKGLVDRCLASSVMLLDCAQLTHWKVEEQFSDMFSLHRDYMPWICLKYEDRDSIGLFENEWNDFDKLTLQTKMLHTTHRRTQPWKTGLPIDWRPAEKSRLFPPAAWLMRARRHLFGDYAFLGHYKSHPDKKQENFFFGLVKECLNEGVFDEAFLREEMRKNHVRHDAIEVLKRTPDLPPAPTHPLSEPLSQAA